MKTQKQFNKKLEEFNSSDLVQLLTLNIMLGDAKGMRNILNEMDARYVESYQKELVSQAKRNLFLTKNQ